MPPNSRAFAYGNGYTHNTSANNIRERAKQTTIEKYLGDVEQYIIVKHRNGRLAHGAKRLVGLKEEPPLPVSIEKSDVVDYVEENYRTPNKNFPDSFDMKADILHYLSKQGGGRRTRKSRGLASSVKKFFGMTRRGSTRRSSSLLGSVKKFFGMTRRSRGRSRRQ